MKVYRLLAKAFPPAFRRRYEAELEATAAELIRSEGSGGLLRRLRLWIGLSIDAVTRGLAERRAERAGAQVRTHVARSIASECHQAVRAVVARPAFAATIICLLGITMGANAAVFGVVDAVLLRPLPYKDPERLVLLWESYAPMHLATLPWSDPDYMSVRGAGSLAGAAVFRPRRAVLAGQGEATSVLAGVVEGGLFALLGVQPDRGRLLTEEDTRAGNDGIVVLSHASWRTRFGGDPNSVGRSISLDNRPVTIVGVLPEGFSFPPPITFSGQMIAPEPEVYLPYTIDTKAVSRGSHGAFAIARLKPGVSVDAARTEIAGIGERIARAYPDTNTNIQMTAMSLHAQSALTIRTILLVLLAAVGGVLLIACASVANLVLARASGRSREMALRAALGASRASLARQLLFENAALGGAGTVLGLLLAHWISSGLIAVNPIALPDMFRSALDWRVLGFTAGLTLAAVFTFGLLPALLASRTDLALMLQSGARATGLPSEQRVKASLAVVQVALALVLLVGSGLAIRSLFRLWSIDPGFRADSVASVGISLPETRYATEAAQREFEQRLLSRVRQLPGVTRVSAATLLPFARQIQDSGDYSIVGLPPRQTGDYLIASYQRTSPGYVDSLRMHILEGRNFRESDDNAAPPVALISESLARRHWATGQAVGHQLRTGGRPDEIPKTIVGVVSDVRMEGFNGRIDPTIYLPLSQSPAANFWTIVTSVRSADRLSADLRIAVREIDASVPVANARLLLDVMGDSVKKPRFTAIVLSAFGVTALLIAAIGLYGVLACDVAQRRREMGVRMALGATPGNIRRLLLMRGVRIVGVGLLLGGLSALACTRLMAGLLVDVPPADAVAYGAATFVLAIASLMATWFPARSATRADPIEALRAQ
jgi:putative ABC transport system permease protein